MDWEKVGVLIAALGVFVMVAGTGVAVYLDRRNASRQRIGSVVAEYGRLCHGHPRVNCGPSAFVQAGARELRNHAEVESAVRSIVARWGTSGHPFAGYREQIPKSIDLKAELIDRLDEKASNFTEVCQQLIQAHERP